VVVRRLIQACRKRSIRFDFAQLSLFVYTLLLVALVHKAANQLEAFFRIASTALPALFVAGLALNPEASHSADKRDRTLVGLVLMFSILLSVVGVSILFLYLGSLPAMVFQGTSLHP